MDYYNFIISYKNNHKDLINKYFGKVEYDIPFNDLIAECYRDQSIQEVMTYDELRIIMYMYYVVAMLELYSNQKNFATYKQLTCIANKIQLDDPDDAKILLKILPPMITAFTNKFTKTHDFRNIFTNENLNSIIQYIYNLVSEFVNECLM